MGYCVAKLSEAEAVSDEQTATRSERKEARTMPWGDGTGPRGLGPMTGRAAGFCAGYPAPGYMNPAGGAAAWGSGAYPVAAPAYGYPGFAGAPRPYAAFARPFGRGWGFGRGRGFGRGFGRGRGRW